MEERVKDAVYRVNLVGSHYLDYSGLLAPYSRPAGQRNVIDLHSSRGKVVWAGHVPSASEAQPGHYKYVDTAGTLRCGYSQDWQVRGGNQFCAWNAYGLSQNNIWGLLPHQHIGNVVKIANGLRTLCVEKANEKDFKDAVYTAYGTKLYMSQFLKDLNLLKNNPQYALRMD